MTATRRRGSSHTWRAILFGREALELGLIKRVGDGESIKIWDDPWIPANYNYKTLVKLPLTAVNRVNELLDVHSRTWDEECVRTNFTVIDAEAILRIPVNAGEDFWAWQPDKMGIFSVRSAYKLLTEEQGRMTQVSGSDNGYCKAFKILWRMEVPPKVRCF